MSLIKTMLERHANLLTEAQLAIGQDIVERLAAKQAFAIPQDMTLLDAQTGYIMIEREFSRTPVNLFGQDVPSLAHTRITIQRARKDEAGNHIPGEPVFSALISEKSLTEAVLLSGRGSGWPMTTTHLGNFAVSARPRIESRTGHSARIYQDEKAERFNRTMKDVENILDGGITRSNTSLKESVASVRHAVHNLASTGFTLDRHLEGMGKLRTEVLTEAAHAALHADKLARVLQDPQKALPAPPAPVDIAQALREHPMLDHALDMVDPDLRELLRRLIVAEITRIGEDFPKVLNWIKPDPQGDTVSFPNSQNRSTAFYGASRVEAPRGLIDALANLWNHYFNPHVEAGRKLRNPSQSAISLSQISGWSGDIHSSMPPSDAAYYCVSFLPAWEEQSLGSAIIRTPGMPLIEIEIVAEDLMTALRGHPSGSPVPCSIRSLCGIYRQPEPRPQHAITTEIDDIDKQILQTPEVQALNAAVQALTDLTESRRTGKAWNAEMQAALAAIKSAFEFAAGRIARDTSAGRDRIDTEIARSTNRILKDIAGSLPWEALDMLLIEQN